MLTPTELQSIGRSMHHHLSVDILTQQCGCLGLQTFELTDVLTRQCGRFNPRTFCITANVLTCSAKVYTYADGPLTRNRAERYDQMSDDPEIRDIPYLCDDPTLKLPG